MSTLAKGTISSNTLNTPYNSVWASIYDLDMAVPQVWGELIQYYGPGVGMLEWLYAANAIVPIQGTSKTLFEEGALVKAVTIGAADIAVQLVAGGNITFGLAATEFTGTDSCYLSLNDAVVIPAEYVSDGGVACTKPEIYQITAVSADDTIAKVFTATPHKSTVTLSTAVPAGTALMVTGGNYANGVQGGSPKSSGWYHRHFVNSTKRQGYSITGSIQSTERYAEKLRGSNMRGAFTKASAEADFLLSKYINDEIILGGGITNTLTMLDRNNNAVQATGTVGVLQHMVTAAMKQYYTLAYSAPDFDDIKDLLNSQGITNRGVAFFVGSLLQKQIENAGLEFLKEFAGGTTLSTMQSWGVDFRQVHKNGITFTLKEIPSFSDPTAYGIDAFEDYFTGLGFIIPDVDVTVRGSLDDPASFKLKNLSLGYKNYNGENRTRIHKVIPGVASINGAGGNIAVDSYDDFRGELLSEFSVIFTKRNQCVLVQNDTVL